MTKFIARGTGLAILLLTLAYAARAEVVTDMYSAEVPVADQSSAELARASRLALAEVLVRVSGSAQVTSNPVIAAALGNARNRVQQYAYRPGQEGSGTLLARLQFESAYVTGLMIEAGAPIWTANRPAVLVWLVMEDGAGRRFVDAGSTPELVQALRLEFSRRGVPLRLPLYDIADTAALTPEQAWQLDAQALVAGSARYSLQDVLAGRFARLSSGGVAGEWTYLNGDDRILRSVTGQDMETFLREGVALVAEAMAARYAVAASVKDGSGLPMTVSGVTSYADYAAVVAWLESLELIERANIESIRGDVISLRLQAQADAPRLAAIIELNKRLVPAPFGDPVTGLNYQWQR